MTAVTEFTDDDEPQVLEEIYKPKPPVLTKASLTDRYLVHDMMHPIINGIVCYPKEVHSGAWCDLKGQLAGLVKAGTLIRTDLEVNVSEKFPAPKTDADPVPALSEENSRLSAEVRKLADDNKTLLVRVDEVLARDSGRTQAIAESVDRIAKLEKALADSRAEAEKLKAEKALSKATDAKTKDAPLG